MNTNECKCQGNGGRYKTQAKKPVGANVYEAAAYTRSLNDRLVRQGLPVHEGVYVCLCGRYYGASRVTNPVLLPSGKPLVVDGCTVGRERYLGNAEALAKVAADAKAARG